MAGDSRPKPLRCVALYAEEDEKGCLDVTLPVALQQDRVLMRRLHHRVIDLLEEKDILPLLARTVEEQLAALSTDVLSDYIEELVNECRTSRKKPPKSETKNEKATKSATKSAAKSPSEPEAEPDAEEQAEAQVKPRSRGRSRRASKPDARNPL